MVNFRTALMPVLPVDGTDGALAGRVWRPGVGPAVVAIRAEGVVDVTATFATMRDLGEAADPAAALRHWHGMLETHGGLYLTVFMPYAELLGDLPENAWYPDHQVILPDGREGRLETRHRLDRQRQLLHREHRYSLSGTPPTTHQSRQTIRWIEHEEMLTLLAQAGFQLNRYSLDFADHPPATHPDDSEFDGILTYQASRIG